MDTVLEAIGVGKQVSSPEGTLAILAGREAVSIGFLGNVVDLWERLAREAVPIDLGSDQTSLHNPFSGGYYPAGLAFEESNDMMTRDPDGFRERVRSSLRRHVEAINALSARGMRFWHYGNAFLLEAGRARADVTNPDGSFRYPSYVEDVMGPRCFDYGFGPYRWICTSGRPEDLRETDRIAGDVLQEQARSAPETIRQQILDNLPLRGGDLEDLGVDRQDRERRCAMIKVSIVLVLGLAAESAFRRHSASVRHWILSCTLACAVLAPALGYVVPHWTVPVDISWLGGRAQDSAFIFGDTGDDGRAAARAAGDVAGGFALSWTSASVIGAAWLAGAIAGLVFLIVGLGRLAFFVSSARPVCSGPWCDALADLAGRSVPMPVRLLQSSHPALLFTWGFRRPAVVLPEGAPAWPPERIRAVLGHELAHVRRRDWAVQMAAGLVRCAYWFNPLIWLACHRLRQAGEQACDDAVLNAGMAASDYAAHVLPHHR